MDSQLVLDVILKGEANIKKLAEEVAEKEETIQQLKRENEELVERVRELEKRDAPGRSFKSIFLVHSMQNHLGSEQKRLFPWDNKKINQLEATIAHNGREKEIENELSRSMIHNWCSFPRDRKYNSTIVLFGGANEKSELDTILYLDDGGKKWLKADIKLPYKEYIEYGVVWLYGGFYQIGCGESGKKVYHIDKIHEGGWREVAEMNEGRQGIRSSCLVWKGSIWVFGGNIRHSHELKSCERYSPVSNQWELLPEMRYARTGASVAVCNGKFIVCGGANKDSELSSVECFDPENGVWTELDNMPLSLVTHGMASVDCKTVVVMGGTRHWKEEIYLDEVMEMTNLDEKWKRLPPLKSARGWLATAVLRNEIYAIGGADNDHKILNRVDIFDGKHWRAGPDLPYNCAEPCVLVIPTYLAADLRQHN